jgi:large subunit ribosomal protein L10
VVKNKLASRASEGTGIAEALKGLKGVSSVAYTSGDPVALAKALSAWVKDNAQFTFKLGIVDGKVINVAEVQALATMPGKEELFSKLLFLINAPAQRLATVMAATGRDLAVVLNQGVEKDKFAAGDASSSEAPAPVHVASMEAPQTEAGATPTTEGAPATEDVPATAETPAPQAEAVAEAASEEKQAEAAATEAPAEG